MRCGDQEEGWEKKNKLMSLYRMEISAVSENDIQTIARFSLFFQNKKSLLFFPPLSLSVSLPFFVSHIFR